MPNKYELQTVTVGALVAEGLEAEANKMPPSYKEQADILRAQAQWYRENERKLVRIWREVPPS